MRIVKVAWKIGTVFCWLAVAFLLAGASGERNQIIAFVLLFVGLGFWVTWPVFTERSRDERIHRDQQASLKRYHKMQARDRREQEWSKRWKSMGIGR